MSRTAELLARLTARGVRLDGGGGGGGSNTDRSMIAASLAGVPRGPFALAMTVYVGDHASRADTVRALLVAASDLCRIKDVIRPGIITDLCELALAEYTRPPVCRHCNGRKQINILGVIHECSECLGTGSRSLTDSDRIAALYLSPTEWRRIKARYGEIYRVLQDWDAQIAAHVAGKLGDFD